MISRMGLAGGSRSFEPGDVLAGKFRVERVLGTGGMGIVVAAHHLGLDQRVALKFIHPHLIADDDAVQRFMREAQAAARIRSEHVGRVFDVGRLGDGAPYIVMEYLDGRDLAEVLRSEGLLPIPDAVEYVLQACEAMAEAHVRGIVHRDLKPQNLFLTAREDGRPLVKVLDFGVSKLSAATAAHQTNPQQMMGSPAYASPEQMRSARDVDARSDIWSLGVILYQLLTGKLPFVSDTVPGLTMQVLNDAPPPIASARPDVPAGLAAAIGRCLEKDRGRRFDNVAELAAAITPCAPARARAALELISRVLRVAEPQHDVPAREGVSSSDATAPASSTGDLAESWMGAPRRRPRWPWIAAGGAAAVTAIVVALTAIGGGSPGEKTRRPAVPAPGQPGGTAAAAREPSLPAPAIVVAPDAGPALTAPEAVVPVSGVGSQAVKPPRRPRPPRPADDPDDFGPRK